MLSSPMHPFLLTNPQMYIMITTMYIPSQEERYSSVHSFTLLLCVVVPSFVVAFACTDMGLVPVLGAFSWPLAYPIFLISGQLGLGMAISAMAQFFAFWYLRRSSLSPKTKTTIAITWGMALALAVRIILAYELYQVVLQAGLKN